MLKQYHQSATHKKNAEANTRAHDFNQKTMQALDTFAEEYEIFEETMKKVTLETEEGDMLYAMVSEVEEELDTAQKDQDRLQHELEFTREEYGHRPQGVHKIAEPCTMQLALMLTIRVQNWVVPSGKSAIAKATHEAVCVEVNQETADLKRKATEAHEKTCSHRERCRRITNKHTSSEAAVNNSLGFLGRCVKEIAGVASLTRSRVA